MLRYLPLAALLVASGCAKMASRRPDWGAMLQDQSTRISAQDRSIRCMEAKNVLAGFDCVQEPTPGDKQHFALLSVRVSPAKGSRSAGLERPVSISIGPGGGGATWQDRTRDGAYDVSATEMQSLAGQQRSALPTAPALIRRTLAAYEASRRLKGE